MTNTTTACDQENCLTCRSFGVVLWEIITKEIPYRDVDSSAIIWGVGSNSLHLPVPDTCPEGFKLLMRQCWSVFTVSLLCDIVNICVLSTMGCYM